MQIITFTTNPNGKLFNDNFSDIRLADGEKYFPGNSLEVKLKNHALGIVQIMACREFKYNQITDVLAYLNIGKPAAYQADLLRRYYANVETLTNDSRLVHIVFKYTWQNISAHQTLLQDWWQNKQHQYPKQSVNQSTLFDNG
jgi:hypothetical protein